MQIIKVNDKKSAKEFLKAPLIIYKKDENWIRPLDRDVEAVFDPKRNKYFSHGEAVRWILTDAKGNLCGRVAAFINEKTANSFDQPTGGMGFFECVNDKEFAFVLFDTCKHWLEKRGMKAMDGPINFGERDKFWGLLVEGFTEPTYGCSYNPPWYKDLFESYGFREYFGGNTYIKEINEPISEKYYERAKEILDDPDYHFEHMHKDQPDKYADVIRTIYNKSWVKHDNFKPMEKAQARAMMKKVKPVADERLVWIGYHKGEPVAIFGMLPELNQIFKYVNGKLNLSGKLIFLWHKWKKTSKRIHGFLFGVIPEYQGKGISSAIIIKAKEEIHKLNRYDDMEMAFIGDFNPRMMALVEGLGAKLHKRHITYRKLFDPDAEFKKAPTIE